MKPQQQTVTTTDEARAIAKDAYIYGFPLVDSYRIQHSYFVDRGGPEFKAPWNQIFNNARVYTPDDKAIQTPNSDTPYSYVGAELRAEPLVLTVPAIEKDRYFSVQLIDAYTFNFAYIGSRATGNDGGSFLLAGPGWKGEKSEGIKEVIRSETEFVFVLYRTQLFKPDDIDNVKKVQAGYKVQTHSAFLGKPAPAAAPKINFLKPLSADQERTSLEFFNVLNGANNRSSLLSANPLNRYLINSPMRPNLKRDADGGLTLYVQHESPGKLLIGKGGTKDEHTTYAGEDENENA